MENIYNILLYIIYIKQILRPQRSFKTLDIMK